MLHGQRLQKRNPSLNFKEVLALSCICARSKFNSDNDKLMKVRQRGPVVRAMGLHAAALGSNPVLLTSRNDFFLDVPYSTPPNFVNSRLVAPCQLGF